MKHQKRDILSGSVCSKLVVRLRDVRLMLCAKDSRFSASWSSFLRQQDQVIN